MNARRWASALVGLLALVTLAVVVSSSPSQPPPAPKKTIFSKLKIGQAVTLKDTASGWEIGTTDDEAPLTHKIAEVEGDHIVLREEAGSVETRIPIYSVRAVVHVRTKGK